MSGKIIIGRRRTFDLLLCSQVDRSTGVHFTLLNGTWAWLIMETCIPHPCGDCNISLHTTVIPKLVGICEMSMAKNCHHCGRIVLTPTRLHCHVWRCNSIFYWPTAHSVVVCYVILVYFQHSGTCCLCTRLYNSLTLTSSSYDSMSKYVKTHENKIHRICCHMHIFIQQLIILFKCILIDHHSLPCYCWCGIKMHTIDAPAEANNYWGSVTQQTFSII